MSAVDRSRTPSRRGDHDRSESRSRRRSGSYSDRSYSDYSDSYYSDEDNKKTGSKAGRKSKGKGPAGKGRGKAAGRNSKAQSSPRGIDNVTKRMLSARRMKINELRSEIEDTTSQLNEAKKENKILIKQQRIQSKQLDKYEGQENELPAIIQRHNEEVRAFKEQLRRQKEKSQKVQKKYRETEEELDRTRRLLKKMKGLVEDKQLKERDELAHKLAKYESDCDVKSQNIQQLDRHIENLNKNHRHELGIERARHRETQQRLQDLQEENQKVLLSLREKEKELEIKNIYSNRVMRPPHKLNSSVTSSPLPDTGRPPRMRHRKHSVPIVTPRERREQAREYEEKRREEMRRMREEGLKKQTPRRHTTLENRLYRIKSNLNANNNEQPEIILINVQKEQPDAQAKSKEGAQKSGRKSQEGKEVSEQSGLKFNFSTAENKQTKSIQSALDRYHQSEPNVSLETADASRKNPDKSPRLKITIPSRQQTRPTVGANSMERERRDRDRIEEDDMVFPGGDKPQNDQETFLTQMEQNKINREEDERRRERERQEKEHVEKQWQAEKEKQRRTAENTLIRQEREQKEKLEAERREEEEKERKERERLERERREKEDKEDKIQREMEREVRELRERAERAKKEQEEKERREREDLERQQREQDEMERKAQSERDRLVNDKAEQERRRKKDLLLAKMKAIDESKDSTISPQTSKNDFKFQEPNEKPQSSNSKKDWQFTEPIENMHHGKPAYNVSVPVVEKNRRRNFLEDDDDVIGGGYQPTFTGNGKKSGPKTRKKGFFDDDNASNGSAKSKGKQAPPKSNKSGFVEDLFGNDSNNKSKSNTQNREQSSTALFGGGNAIIDNDEAPPRSNSHLLPRRGRQPSTTISSRPTVNAIDSVDDDIEEVML